MSEAADDILLELYVRGQSEHSSAAIYLVRRVCEARLGDRFRLEVIDITEQPERARAARIIAVPVFLRARPEPARRATGRLTERRILEVLERADA